MNLILAVFFMFLGVISGFPVVKDYLDNYEYKMWNVADGKVNDSSYEEYQCRSLCGKDSCKDKTDTVSCYRPRIKYEFYYDGKVINGEYFYPYGKEKDHTLSEISDIKSEFYNDKKIRVFYNSKNGNISSFLRIYENSIGRSFFLICSLSFIFISIGFFIKYISNFKK